MIVVGTNHPLKASQIWEEEPFSIVDKYVNVPPTLELICDPSDSMIIGNRFRKEDVINRETAHAWDCWVPGTQFRNVKTGKVFEVYTHTQRIVRGGKITRIKQNKWKEVNSSDQLELIP